MTADATPEDPRVLGLSGEADPLSASELERAEATIEALLRLRTQLLHTQAALDEYLEQLGTTAAAEKAPGTPNG